METLLDGRSSLANRRALFVPTPSRKWAKVSGTVHVGVCSSTVAEQTHEQQRAHALCCAALRHSLVISIYMPFSHGSKTRPPNSPATASTARMSLQTPNDITIIPHLAAITASLSTNNRRARHATQCRLEHISSFGVLHPNLR